MLFQSMTYKEARSIMVFFFLFLLEYWEGFLPHHCRTWWLPLPSPTKEVPLTLWSTSVFTHINNSRLFSHTTKDSQDVIISITPPTLLDFEHLSCQKNGKGILVRTPSNQVTTFRITWKCTTKQTLFTPCECNQELLGSYFFYTCIYPYLRQFYPLWRQHSVCFCVFSCTHCIIFIPCCLV